MVMVTMFMFMFMFMLMLMLMSASCQHHVNSFSTAFQQLFNIVTTSFRHDRYYVFNLNTILILIVIMSSFIFCDLPSSVSCSFKSSASSVKIAEVSPVVAVESTKKGGFHTEEEEGLLTLSFVVKGGWYNDLVTYLNFCLSVSPASLFVMAQPAAAAFS